MRHQGDRPRIPDFRKKVLSFGEIHGIEDLTPAKLGIIGKWLAEGRKVTLALERAYDQQSLVLDWLAEGKPGRQFKALFSAPATSHYLSDQFSFLQGLADIPSAKRKKLKVLCADMSFAPRGTDKRARLSREILNCADEDEFDRRRELFLISQFEQNRGLLEKSDRVLFAAGNMHASKTRYYFPLGEKQYRHIPTVTGWLNARYGCESVFTLPFSGHTRYQGPVGLKKNPVALGSPPLKKIAASPFNGFAATKHSGVRTASFLASYDWLFGIKKCTPSAAIW
ncbi:MAG: hypothetical protein A2X31_02015 [Elusimicrobia bacterium GWB2_63_22]|nr:MAG: hypothetical protein A2X31_02015 [Elusimicrobia bacterium GWB2_63_22]